jgi:hypothetical protein
VNSMTEKSPEPGSKAAAAFADKYVQTNMSALIAVGMVPAPSVPNTQIDPRIGAALCRRGLLWEQPKGCFHLTDTGTRVLDLWDARQAGPPAEETHQ